MCGEGWIGNVFVGNLECCYCWLLFNEMLRVGFGVENVDGSFLIVLCCNVVFLNMLWMLSFGLINFFMFSVGCGVWKWFVGVMFGMFWFDIIR